MSEPTRILGIVNVTGDSFSDGGRYLDPTDAIRHARQLRKDGATIVELGAASSHPDARAVDAHEEIRRLEPIVEALEGVPLGIDTWKPETQVHFSRRVAMLNDIEGFRHTGVHAELAQVTCSLVVMHSVQRSGKATRVETDAGAVLDGMFEFFSRRIAELEAAGVERSRLILDPGMGFFLGSTPEPSLRALAQVRDLESRFGLPVLISVSRKSFLGAVTGRELQDRGPVTLAAELEAVRRGAAWIRTHDVAQLSDALRVTRAIAQEQASA